jgi:hypothetical protein
MKTFFGPLALVSVMVLALFVGIFWLSHMPPPSTTVEIPIQLDMQGKN